MTDEQRRYYLYRLLIYYFGGTSGSVSYITQAFWLDFVKNESLILTDNNISSFKTKFFEFLDACSNSGYTNPVQYISNANTFDYLISAFNELNVVASTQSSASNYSLILTAPDNTQYGLYFSPVLSSNAFVIRPRQEIEYAKVAKNTMNLQNITYESLSSLKNMCGKNSYWEYDSTNNRVLINGSGSTKAVAVLNPKSSPLSTPYNQLLNCTTMVINENITEMQDSSTTTATEYLATSGFQFKTIVFKHSNNDTLNLVSGWIPAPKSATNPKQTYDIYADHSAVRNYAYSSNITVNLHPLSEWED